MKVVIVDENDNPIGLREREQWAEGEIHRVSALWLKNPEGKFLLCQRALMKKHAPGKWGPAVAGTVDEGEDYVSNIIKETKEEIGIDITKDQLILGPKFLVGPSTNRRFTQWFLATLDIPPSAIITPPDEVMDSKWVTEDELKKWLAEKPDDFVGNAVLFIPPLLAWNSTDAPR